MMYQRRRRLIRSGHFGTMRQNNPQEKKEGLMTVKRVKPCDMNVNSNTNTLFNLSYVIYRPDLLHLTAPSADNDSISSAKKPLIVIHGGPGIPSDYLQPSLTQNIHTHSNNNNNDHENKNGVVEERCIIFFDQIGCGNSSAPSDINYYSTSNTVNDLEQLIHHLKIQEFHLYGHSYGGIIAYEYFKRHADCSHTNKVLETTEATVSSCHPQQPQPQPRLLSVTLCSAPSNVCSVEEESKELLKSLNDYDPNDLHGSRSRSNSHCSNCSMSSNTTTSTSTTDEMENDGGGGQSSRSSSSSMDTVMNVDNTSSSTLLFQQHFVCRTITNDGIFPPPLQDAFSKMGKVYFGTDVILDYVAEPLSQSSMALSSSSMSMSKQDTIPVLLVRGEHDFVSRKYGFDEWRGILQNSNVVCKTLQGCSHYSMLENPTLHSMALNSFLNQCERGEEDVGVGEDEDASCVNVASKQ